MTLMKRLPISLSFVFAVLALTTRESLWWVERECNALPTFTTTQLYRTSNKCNQVPIAFFIIDISNKWQDQSEYRFTLAGHSLR